MMSNLAFSVIIPTYHRNDLLAKCLDCLKPGVQTLAADQYEVIVTDDGRTTTAESMIREHYPWVRWVAGPQKGPAANRNNGARAAQGEWLVFTDDDCLPDAQWLEAYAQAIIPGMLVYEGKTTCEVGIYSPLEQAPVNLTGGYLWSCNMIIYRNLFQHLNGFDENFPYPHMEDVELRDRLNDIQQTFLFVDRAIVDHPPKQMPFGIQIAKLHESSFYYYQKRQIVMTKRRFFKQLIIARLKNILAYPFSIGSLKALLSLVIELRHTLLNFRQLQR